MELKGPVVSPNWVISVSQINFVAPFSPHHQLKYLCNKTNLNVKQVCYFSPPPRLKSHLLCPLFSKCPSLSHFPPLSHTPFYCLPWHWWNRPRVCNLVLITTSDLRCDLHPSASRASQEGDVNVRPEVITVITARKRSHQCMCVCPCMWRYVQVYCECECILSFWMIQFDIFVYRINIAVWTLGLGQYFHNRTPLDALMPKTKQDWSRKQWGLHHIYAIIDKCNYNWCSDSFKFDYLLHIILLFP